MTKLTLSSFKVGKAKATQYTSNYFRSRPRALPKTKCMLPSKSFFDLGTSCISGAITVKMDG